MIPDINIKITQLKTTKSVCPISGCIIKSDTIDNVSKVKKAKNIEILTISHLVGEAIKRISNSTSVSDLFN